MEKRYQVFISSTFADLQDERAKVQQTIMEMDCIPAGMEVFPAIDEEQFEFIKKVIDDCDYYILIIGGRYGSLSDAGVSYTEMEYEYAISKGIKVMAFLHDDPSSLPLKKTEQVTGSKKKLAAFRDKVATGRLVKFWSVANELPGLVALSLSKTIKTYPAIGWIRASGAQNPGIYEELGDLQKQVLKLTVENAELKSYASIATSAKKNEKPQFAGLNDQITLTGKSTPNSEAKNPNWQPWEVIITWGQLFGELGIHLMESRQERYVEVTVARMVYQFSDTYTKAESKNRDAVLNPGEFQKIKLQFKALGLIEIRNSAFGPEWEINDFGERKMLEIKAIRKTAE